MILGTAEGSPSQCRSSLQVPAPQFFPNNRTRPLLRYCSYPRFCHSVREADVPLEFLTRHFGSNPHDVPFDAGSMMVDKCPSPPNPPAPTFDHNGELPTSPFPVPWTSETIDLSPCLSRAGPSRVGLGDLTSATSRFIGGTEVPRSRMHHAPSFHNLGLPFDNDDGMRIGGGLTGSIPCGADDHYESAVERRFARTDSHPCHPGTVSCPPVDQRGSEPIGVDGPTPPDHQHFPLSTHADHSMFGVASLIETRGAGHGLSYSAPAYTWQPPPDRTSLPLSRSSHPSSLELAHTNSISPLCQTVPLTDPPNATSGCASLAPLRSHHLQPPPEVATLLTTQSSGDVVSTVFARNSPLVPWELPSEIEYFWLGLFKISEVKVTHAYQSQTNGLISLWVWLFVRWKQVRGEAPQTTP
jgi:hypothetical protein